MSLIITLRNISSLAEVSDYEYKVLVGDGSPERSKVLETGTVRDHQRSEGWEALVKKFLFERTRTDRKDTKK